MNSLIEHSLTLLMLSRVLINSILISRSCFTISTRTQSQIKLSLKQVSIYRTSILFTHAHPFLILYLLVETWVLRVIIFIWKKMWRFVPAYLLYTVTISVGWFPIQVLQIDNCQIRKHLSNNIDPTYHCSVYGESDYPMSTERTQRPRRMYNTAFRHCYYTTSKLPDMYARIDSISSLYIWWQSFVTVQ